MRARSSGSSSAKNAIAARRDASTGATLDGLRVSGGWTTGGDLVTAPSAVLVLERAHGRVLAAVVVRDVVGQPERRRHSEVPLLEDDPLGQHGARVYLGARHRVL